MNRIYEGAKGQWRVKGYYGFSPTRQKAELRFKTTHARAKPLRIFASILKTELAEDKAGFANRAFSGNFTSSFKKTINHFFREREFRREAIIRAKQQQKLGKYI